MHSPTLSSPTDYPERSAQGGGGPPGGWGPPGGYPPPPPGGYPPGGYPPGGYPPGAPPPPAGAPPGGYGAPPGGYPAPGVGPSFGGPPAGGGPGADLKKQATQWLVISAVSFMVCGCCFGLIGGIFCFMAMQAADQGNLADASEKLKWGKIVTLVGFALGLIGAIVTVALYAAQIALAIGLH